MHTAAELLAYISPTISIPGYRPFCLAIERTERLLHTQSFDQILMTKEVYHGVSEACGLSIQTTERQIYRAVDFCWQDGGNAHLNEIIGRKLPAKSSPRDIILYCAYYLTVGKPYHAVAGAGPLLF